MFRPALVPVFSPFFPLKAAVDRTFPNPDLGCFFAFDLGRVKRSAGRGHQAAVVNHTPERMRSCMFCV